MAQSEHFDGSEEKRSIDSAIDVCDAYIEDHRRSARQMLFILLLVSIVNVSLLVFFIWSLTRTSGVAATESFSNAIIFALLAIFTIVFGVVMSIYRFHLKEISKAEHYKIGFLRIRIAANNQSEGFQSEVRLALTEKAFAFEPPPFSIAKGKKAESPLLGHPTSDLSAMVLNKVLEGLEIRVGKKEKNV